MIRETIPVAWRQLIEGSDEQLIDLFADKVESICGYKPDPEELAVYLQENVSKPITVAPQKGTLAASGKTESQKPFLSQSYQREPKQKGATLTIENQTIIASTVGDLYLKVLKYLCESDLIEQAKQHIPYATSSVRLLISADPHHQGGNEFRTPIYHGGYYMEAHKSYKTALSHLEAFLKTCGIQVKY